VRPVGLTDDDGPAGGAADRAGFAVELERERVLGDVDADGAPGVDAAERHAAATVGRVSRAGSMVDSPTCHVDARVAVVRIFFTSRIRMSWRSQREMRAPSTPVRSLSQCAIRSTPGELRADAC
jgi:hypothetical protein